MKKRHITRFGGKFCTLMFYLSDDDIAQIEISEYATKHDTISILYREILTTLQQHGVKVRIPFHYVDTHLYKDICQDVILTFKEMVNYTDWEVLDLYLKQRYLYILIPY